MLSFLYYWLGFLFLMSLSFLSFGLGVFFFIEGKVIFLEWLILCMNSSMLSYTIILDWMSLMFIGVVCFISGSVIFYSQDYLSQDLYLNRFFILVMGFVFSMLMLIMSPSLVGILLGWDGLGLISYCLVIYFQNNNSHSAGMLTVLVNRLGDAFLIIGICWMLNCGCWHYFFYSDSSFMSYVSYFVLVASFTSSAQIPFSSWLPAAMAAPTPVSALVHSSTLVTAGVYLMIRFYSSLEQLECELFLLLALLTMIMSGFSALTEYDMSSVVALSTLSQLGLMMSCLLIGFPSLCFFHLLTHALFKSLMFLCVGIYIHGMKGAQDMRSVGLVFLSYPFVSACFCISSLSLCGFPFLSGYYSKDWIMEFISMGGFNLGVFTMFYFSACLTVIYTFRLILYSLTTQGTSMTLFLVGKEEGGGFFSILLLSVVTVVGGSGLFWLVLSKPSFIILPLFIKSFPLVLFGLGMLIVLEYLMLFQFTWGKLNIFSNNLGGFMWFMPSLFKWVSLFFINHSFFVNFCLDKGWLESYGPRGTIKFLLFYLVKIYSLGFNSAKLVLVWLLVLICLFIIWI
uniref:NADH-ubiquinone oxidoreductase chain 5 n=1 Tax=Hackeriella veitchi TaxID=60873 RepID=L7N6H6_9HEMI|nr:NADH dehydrogenase subunit 5 [Hackeriella veitchi]ACV96707.1 NADH dehydrogenase subunit 5 [Hackeriella veitchi]